MKRQKRSCVVEQLESRQLLSAAPPLIGWFPSTSRDDVGVIRPDCTVAIGPSNMLTVVNGQIKSFGATTWSSDLQTFFGLRPESAIADQETYFDPASQQFIVTATVTDEGGGLQFNPRTSKVMVATSRNSDINPDTGGGWDVRWIDTSSIIPDNFGGSGYLGFLDQPRFAITDTALYICGEYGGFEIGAPGDTGQIYVVKKSSLHGSGAFTSGVDFTSRDTGDSLYMPVQPLSALPSGVGDYLLKDEQLITVHYDSNLANVTVSAATQLSGPSFSGGSEQNEAPNKSTNIYDGFGFSHRPVWRSGSIYNATVVYPADGTTAEAPVGEATILWEQHAQVGSNGQPWMESDWGLIGGEDSAPHTRTSYPAITVNANGDVAIGFTATGPNIYAGAYYAVHRAHDAFGQISLAGTLAQGADTFTDTSGFPNWGDYSGIALDPTNDQRFWVFNQYAMTNPSNDPALHQKDWGTMVGYFDVPHATVISVGDSGQDNTVWIEAEDNDPTTIDVTVNGALAYQYSIDTTEQIIIDDAGNDAQVWVCSWFANPIPTNGLVLNGGGNTNEIYVTGAVGGSSATIEGTASSKDGIFNLDGQTVEFHNADEFTFMGDDGNDTFSVNSAMGTSVNYNLGGGHDVLNVNNGATMTVGTSPADSQLTVYDNATVLIPGGIPDIGALHIGDGAIATMEPGATPNASTLDIPALTIAPTGVLDLTNNSMIAFNFGPSSTPFSTIVGYLRTGYGTQGRWDGYGITSSNAAADPAHLALGYTDGADGVIDGLSAGEFLVKFTVAGDANLDGQVDSTDLGILATHYGHAAAWDQGDFNYDAFDNVIDLGILATNTPL